jgi:hypothetical protein
MEFIDDAFRPPEPQLLDTCILQNLDWIDRQLEEKERVVWDDAALLELSERYGSDAASNSNILAAIPGWFAKRIRLRRQSLAATGAQDFGIL